MASGGGLVGGIIGAVAGFVIGGPTGAMYGYSIGSMAGGYLDPPKGPTSYGPRLDDLSVQTSTYGAPIPRVYGSIAVTGNIFWLENNQLKESRKKTKVGGSKSNSTSVTYSYSATFAVGLCEGPIAGVRRIWIGSKLVYDAGAASLEAIMASNQTSSLFTLYKGTDTQLADSRMQATLGVTNTPAYRGLAYIVFKDYPLAEHSNSLLAAQVKVEVVQVGTSVIGFNKISDTLSYSARYKHGFVNFKGLYFVIGGFLQSNSSVINEIWTSADTITWQKRSSNLPSLGGFGIVEFNGSLYISGGTDSSGSQVGSIYKSDDGLAWTLISTPFSGRSDHCMVVHDNKMWVLGGYPNAVGWESWWSSNGINWFRATDLPYSFRNQFAAVSFNNRLYILGGTGGQTYLEDVQSTADGLTWTLNKWIYDPAGSRYGHELEVVGNKMWLIGGRRAGAETSSVMTSSDGVNWVEETMNPTLTDLSAYARSIVVSNSIIYVPRSVVRAYTIAPTFSMSGVLLSSIVQAECLKSNLLTAADIDVTQLTQSVRGYKVSTESSLRTSIEPLMATFRFEPIQIGYKLKFKPRGQSSVATISANELGARSDT